jgi:hypothetical protein
MSISDYIKKQEYIVTVNNSDDLSQIYDELESAGKYPPGTEIFRSVQCINRRPTSRNTHYMLSAWEADQLRNDPRIKSVSLAPNILGIQPGLNYVEQTSNNWDKSGSTNGTMKNWALLRCTEGVQRTGWGGTGYDGDGTGTPGQTATISLAQTGKNVDVVVCDENGIAWNHPEYAVNVDGSGGSRAVQYNWFQHNAEIGNGSNGTYTYGVGGHSTHVAGTIAGNTQGWARSANIYNLFYDAGGNDSTFVFDYVRAFHRNKTINVATARKNPTIVNNSWGYSIFPSEWSFGDITAVTYRGTRYVPSGEVSYTGFSGVCTANARLATLQGFENHGNRISTTGPYVPPGGSIQTKPESWSQEGQQAFLTILSEPASSYELTVQGPADISLIHNVAIDAISGSMSLENAVRIFDSSLAQVAVFSNGPSTTENGGTIEVTIEELYNLANNEVYTIRFNTIANTVGVTEPLFAAAMSLTVITESTPAAASVTTVTNSLLGAAALTSSTVPTTGSNDDGFWTLNLPFDIQYLGNTYSTIYVGTNHYVTFGSGSSVYTGLSATTPNLPKIMWACADNSVQRIYYGVEGTAPNRTYRVRIEGNASTSGTVGNPGMLCEYTFYEATPNQIDLQLGVNNRKTTGGGFTTEQLNNWGFISGQRIPLRVPGVDADLEDAYSEGIVMVGAAGNGRWKHDLPGGADWDNTFEMSIRYPDSVTQPYYYMRGTSPTANDTVTDGGVYDLPAICVGSVDTTSIDQKVSYSDCGPGVDLWAPGTYIMSSYTGGVSDSRNNSFFNGKISGTSMASPQVCGVLACALEIYPHLNQQSAKDYIVRYAKLDQLTGTDGGATDGQDLQGAPNLFLYYYKERVNSGNVFPKINYKPRPSIGAVFPRLRIRRTL